MKLRQISKQIFISKLIHREQLDSIHFLPPIVVYPLCVACQFLPMIKNDAAAITRSRIQNKSKQIANSANVSNKSEVPCVSANDKVIFNPD